MSQKRISNAMEKALNEQMTQEAYQAQIYLAYATWAEENALNGTATFLYKHAHEEREHMFKIIKYIINRGGSVKVTAISAPPAKPKDLGDCLRKLHKHEMDNSKKIDAIVDLAHTEKDWATFNFGNWFVKEQIEEETLVSDLLDKYTLAAGKKVDGVNILDFDQDMATASQEATIPREETY